MKMLTMNADLFDLMEQLEKDGKHPVAAHCIAADFGMMGGIAKQFVDRMDMRNKLWEWVKTTSKQQSFIHTRPNPYGSYGDSVIGIMHWAIRVDNVYNLITKQWTYEWPTYDDLVAALDNLKAAMVRDELKLLVIPKLGCGIDGLSWNVVRRLITSTFQSTDITVIVAIPGDTSTMSYDELWKEVFGGSYKGYQGEPL